jgi:hypothetical protein
MLRRAGRAVHASCARDARPAPCLWHPHAFSWRNELQSLSLIHLQPHHTRPPHPITLAKTLQPPSQISIPAPTTPDPHPPINNPLPMHPCMCRTWPAFDLTSSSSYPRPRLTLKSSASSLTTHPSSGVCEREGEGGFSEYFNYAPIFRGVCEREGGWGGEDSPGITACPPARPHAHPPTLTRTDNRTSPIPNQNQQ